MSAIETADMVETKPDVDQEDVTETKTDIAQVDVTGIDIESS